MKTLLLVPVLLVAGCNANRPALGTPVLVGANRYEAAVGSKDQELEAKAAAQSFCRGQGFKQADSMSFHSYDLRLTFECDNGRMNAAQTRAACEVLFDMLPKETDPARIAWNRRLQVEGGCTRNPAPQINVDVWR